MEQTLLEKLPPYVYYTLASIGAIIGITFAIKKFYSDKTDRLLSENTKTAKKDFEIEQLKKDAETNRNLAESINQKMHDLDRAFFVISRQHEEILDAIIDIKSQLKTKK